MHLVIDDLASLKLAQATASTARISSSIELATVLQSEIIISDSFLCWCTGERNPASDGRNSSSEILNLISTLQPFYKRGFGRCRPL